jgi:hypothetical protein
MTNNRKEQVIELIAELFEKSDGEFTKGEIVGVHVMVFSERLVFTTAGAADTPSNHAMECINKLLNRKHESLINVIYKILGVAEVLNDLAARDSCEKAILGLIDKDAAEMIKILMKIKKGNNNG